MSTNTTNYNLVKPDYSESADIGVINGNMDIIDSNLKSVLDVANSKANSMAGDSVASGTNLDNLRMQGYKVYWVNFSQVTNGPITSGYGFLENVRVNETGAGALQRVTRYASSGSSNGIMYIRFYMNNTWTNWVQVTQQIT